MVPSRENNCSKSCGAEVFLKCLKNSKESSVATAELIREAVNDKAEIYLEMDILDHGESLDLL